MQKRGIHTLHWMWWKMSDYIKSDLKGFDDLAKMLKQYEVTEEETMQALEAGAKEFVSDVRKLPKPRSQVRVSGYAHLIDTVTYKRNRNELEVGWGKYYGPMVEHGTMRMKGTPHIKTTFERNKGKYFKTIKNRLFG